MNVKTFLVIVAIVIQIKGDVLKAKHQNDKHLNVGRRAHRTTPKYMTRREKPPKLTIHGRPTTPTYPPKPIKVPKPKLESDQPCEYKMYYCNRAYKTSKICSRTLYYQHATFASYCEMDYINCRYRYDTWHIVHMGPCFDYVGAKDFNHYEYMDDLFLDQTYVVQV